MTYQPSGDSLLVDHEPMHDPAFKRWYVSEFKKAKKEGPKLCSRCKESNLRVKNRKKGVCSKCQREMNNP